MKKRAIIFPLVASILLVVAFPVLINGQETEINKLINRAVWLANMGRTKEAVQQWLGVIEKDPNSVMAYQNLGVTYVQAKEFDKAIEAFKKAIELDPSNEKAHEYLGNTYADIGEYEQAIAEHKKVLEIDPDYADVFVDLGFVYAKKGDLQEAMSNYKKALSINPVHPMARKNLGLLYYEMGKWTEAIDELIYARNIDDWYPDVEETLRAVLYKAFSDLKKWVKEEPMEPLAHYYLSYALLYKTKAKKAIEEIDKAIELDSSMAKFYAAKGAFSYNLEHYEWAAEAYEKCVALDPSNWEACIMLAELYAFFLGDVKKGFDAAIRARYINPDVIRVQAVLGGVYSCRGEQENSVAAFLKAASLGGGRNPTITSGLAACYFNLERYDEAWQYARLAQKQKAPMAKYLIRRLKEVSKEPEWCR